jgi:probable HAF family extracellular repeat protein
MSHVPVAICAITTALVLGAPAAQGQYTAIEIPVPEGFQSVVAVDINSNGQVALFAEGAMGATRTFIWDHGQLTPIPSPGPDHYRNEPCGINDAGEVGGTSRRDGAINALAWVWRDGQLHDLGTLGGEMSGAQGINNNGQITGWSYPAEPGVFGPFLQDAQGMRRIGRAALGHSATADDINDDAVIVGDNQYFTTSHGRAILATEQLGSFEIGTLGGLSSAAHAVSNDGVVVGVSDTGPTFAEDIGGQEVTSWVSHGFIWRDGVMKDLGTLPGHNFSTATDVNIAGDVVGASWIDSKSDPANPRRRAVTWLQGAAAADLNDLVPPGGPTMINARAINAAGQIVTSAVAKDGSTHCLLLTPVP